MCYQINIDVAEIWAPLDTTSQRSRWSFAPNPSGVVRKIRPLSFYAPLDHDRCFASCIHTRRFRALSTPLGQNFVPQKSKVQPKIGNSQPPPPSSSLGPLSLSLQGP